MFTPEEESFRSELRSFLDEHLPAGWAGPADESNDDHWRLTMKVRQELARRGWLAMSWPVEYGGRNASPMLSMIFAEEMAYRRAPGNDRFGTRMIGPTLIAFGTEDQKRQHLPGIARGEVQWCQGYSEPDAGSDLASLQTRAEDAGDHFLVNGGKIWTSLAHRADWMFMLARTDQSALRHRGISMLLVDMKSPGITVRPIYNMSGSHSFNQVTFDNVAVPKSGMVGALNDGWRVGTALLNHERANIDYIAWAQRTLDELKGFAKSEKGPGGKALASDPLVRTRIVDFEAKIEEARLITYEAAWMLSKGRQPVAESSMSKYLGSEVNLQVHEWGLELLGMHGQLEPGSAGAKLSGRIFKLRMFYTSGPILAGTNEIQKNIIAQRGLGMSRE